MRSPSFHARFTVGGFLVMISLAAYADLSFATGALHRLSRHRLSPSHPDYFLTNGMRSPPFILNSLFPPRFILSIRSILATSYPQWKMPRENSQQNRWPYLFFSVFVFSSPCPNFAPSLRPSQCKYIHTSPAPLYPLLSCERERAPRLPDNPTFVNLSVCFAHS